LNNNQLDEIIELIAETKIDGIVVSNTSVNREGLKTSPEVLAQIGNGGLSGKPIRERSTKMIKYLSDKSNRAFPIIGVAEFILQKMRLKNWMQEQLWFSCTQVLSMKVRID
jgi:dihydroorotate dehydrogenase